MMCDYCPECGSDDLDSYMSYMNGESHCNGCGHTWEDEEE